MELFTCIDNLIIGLVTFLVGGYSGYKIGYKKNIKTKGDNSPIISQSKNAKIKVNQNDKKI